jgi:hypothetical protein
MQFVGTDTQERGHCTARFCVRGPYIAGAGRRKDDIYVSLLFEGELEISPVLWSGLHNQSVTCLIIWYQYTSTSCAWSIVVSFHSSTALIQFLNTDHGQLDFVLEQKKLQNYCVVTPQLRRTQTSGGRDTTTLPKIALIVRRILSTQPYRRKVPVCGTWSPIWQFRFVCWK